MAEQTWAAVHVQDVAANAAFYTDRLGWWLDRHDPDGDVAHVVDADGYAINQDWYSTDNASTRRR